jgi:hypothetical protein
MTAMQEFVVPRSMPKTFAIKILFWLNAVVKLLPCSLRNISAETSPADGKWLLAYEQRLKWVLGGELKSLKTAPRETCWRICVTGWRCSWKWEAGEE